MPLDQVQDSNRSELVYLSEKYTFPDFVKQADADDLFETEKLAQHVYAYPQKKLYPCHNPASTWLSALFFEEKRASFRPVDQAMIEDRINRMASYFQIGKAVRDLRKEAASKIKSAEDMLPDTSFAFVWLDGNTKQRKLPLTSAMHVKKAAEWLEKYRDKIPFEDKHVMANKILEKAAHFGAGISEHFEFLEKHAGRGICDPDVLQSQINERSRLVGTKDPELRGVFTKIAESIRDTPSMAIQPDALVKIAVLIDQFDRINDLTRHYGERLKRPEDCLFTITFTKASTDLFAVVETANGKAYEKTDLQRVKVADLRDLFGDEFADSVSDYDRIDVEKFAEQIETLPRPDATNLESLLDGYGIRPATVKAANAALTDDELLMLADLHGQLN